MAEDPKEATSGEQQPVVLMMGDGKGGASPLPADPIVTSLAQLRIVSKETSWEEVDRLDLPNRIKRALPTAWIRGFGLAACQIGVPLQYARVELDGETVELLNPKITYGAKPALLNGEGCLSIPNKRFDTIRYSYIIYETETRAVPEIKDEKGNVTQKASEGGRQTFEAFGIAAAVIQHEISHMEGKLAPDYQQNPYKNLGRNDLCGCGSGRKYKKCCLK